MEALAGNTPKASRCDPSCSPKALVVRATSPGTAPTLLSHLRHNTAGPRDLHGNIKGTIAVTVNNDDGIDNVSTGK